MSAAELSLYRNRLLGDIVAETALYNGNEVVELLKDFLYRLRSLPLAINTTKAKAGWADDFAGMWSDDEMSASETVEMLRKARDAYGTSQQLCGYDWRGSLPFCRVAVCKRKDPS